jgi:hypothetical protein
MKVEIVVMDGEKIVKLGDFGDLKIKEAVAIACEERNCQAEEGIIKFWYPKTHSCGSNLRYINGGGCVECCKLQVASEKSRLQRKLKNSTKEAKDARKTHPSRMVGNKKKTYYEIVKSAIERAIIKGRNADRADRKLKDLLAKVRGIKGLDGTAMIESLCKIGLKNRGDVCDISGWAVDSGRTLCWDHCHQLGHHRGWLHPNINSGIGLMGDDPLVLLKSCIYLLKNEASLGGLEVTSGLSDLLKKFMSKSETDAIARNLLS